MGIIGSVTVGILGIVTVGIVMVITYISHEKTGSTQDTAGHTWRSPKAG